jgi:hypothetical protein
MWKDWGSFNTDNRKNDFFQGDSKSNYSTIEGPEIRDNVNDIDLQRPLRNVYEDAKDMQWFKLWSTIYELGNEQGILKHSLTWAFSGDTNDIETIRINPGTGDTFRFFSRIKSGMGYVSGNLIVSRPQIWIAERQIAKILQINDWKDESVTIKYFYNNDLYQAKIIQRDANGIPQPFYFTNQNNQVTIAGAGISGDSAKWGDSRYGYHGAIKLFEAMHRTWPVLFRASLADSVYRIYCEPYYKLPYKWFGDTIFWKIGIAGNVYGDSRIPVSGEQPLQAYRFQVVNQLASVMAGTRGDSRKYIQNTQDFSTSIYCNTPPYFGDTSSYSDSQPWSDSQGYKFTTIANRNGGLVVYNQNAGKNNSALFYYMNSNIPGVYPVRSGSWWANKDIVASRWTNVGDTLGAAWASVMSISGDSWIFWGNKAFKNGALFPYEATGHFLGSPTNKWEMVADSITVNRVYGSGLISADSLYITRTIYADTIFSGTTIKAAGLVSADSFYATRTIVTNTISILNGSFSGLISADSLYVTRTIWADTIFAGTTIKAIGLISADSIYVTRTGTFGGTVSANIFNATSTITAKENIQKFEERATDILSSVEVVSFNFKNDEENRIGFIAEDTHEYLAGKEHSRMDITNALGLIIKSIQELRDDINELKREI